MSCLEPLLVWMFPLWRRFTDCNKSWPILRIPTKARNSKNQSKQHRVVCLRRASDSYCPGTAPLCTESFGQDFS